MRIEAYAALTLDNSVITGNNVRSRGHESCGSFTCSRALGGGITSLGNLTLNGSVVSNNAVLNLGASADVNAVHGGGIYSPGTTTGLTVNGSRVTENAAKVTGAIGWTTDDGMGGTGGGVDALGTVTIRKSTISKNKLTLTETSAAQTGALSDAGGGLSVAGQVTVEGSRIDDNSVTLSCYSGNVYAAGAGIEQLSGTLDVANSELNANRASASVTATAPSAQASAGVAAGPGALDLNGSHFSVERTRFIGNTVMSTSHGALANGGTTAAGAAIFNASLTPATMTDIVIKGSASIVNTTSGPTFLAASLVQGLSSLTLVRSTVSGNTSRVTATGSGNAALIGVGVGNAGTLTLKSTTVTDNKGAADGPAGKSQGAGIWSADVGGGPPTLSLIDSAVTRNALTSSGAAVPVHGAGIFSTAHVTLTNSIVAHNVPDQCFGC